MHNEEGKLFEAVFHKLLALGVIVVSVAAVVWIVWAIARASQISNDAATPPEPPAVDDSAMLRAPIDEAPLANVRPTIPGQGDRSTGVGSPDRMIALTVRPVAVLVNRVHGRLPAIVQKAAADAAFFGGGPS